MDSDQQLPQCTLARNIVKQPRDRIKCLFAVVGPRPIHGAASGLQTWTPWRAWACHPKETTGSHPALSSQLPPSLTNELTILGVNPENQTIGFQDPGTLLYNYRRTVHVLLFGLRPER